MEDSELETVDRSDCATRWADSIYRADASDEMLKC